MLSIRFPPHCLNFVVFVADRTVKESIIPSFPLILGSTQKSTYAVGLEVEVDVVGLVPLVVGLETGATQRTYSTTNQYLSESFFFFGNEDRRGQQEKKKRTSPIPRLVHCALTFGLFVYKSPSDIPAAAAIW